MAQSTRSKSNQSVTSEEAENPQFSNVESEILHQRMLLKEKQLKEQTDHLNKQRAEFERTRAEQSQIRDLLSVMDTLRQEMREVREQVAEFRHETSAPTQSIASENFRASPLRPARELSGIPEIREHVSARRESNGSLESSPLRLKDVAESIPKYDGQRISVFQFCQSCERALKLIPVHQEKYLVQLIMGRLQGHAYTIMQDSAYVTVEPLLRKLKGIFGPNKSLNQYRGELGNAYMRPNESIFDYITRIKELQTAIVDAETEQRGRELDVDTRYFIDRDVLDSFINGLPSELLVRIKIEGYATLDLDDAFAKAIHLTKTLETEAQRRRPAFAPPPAKLPRRDAPPIQILPRSNNVPFIKPLIPGQPGPNAPRNIVCYYCKNPGHIMSECRKKAFNEKQNRQIPRREPEPTPSTSRENPSGNDARAPTNPSVQRDTNATGRKVMTSQVSQSPESP